MKINDFKMRVNHKESYQIQKFLIKNGYNWHSMFYDRRFGECGDRVCNIFVPYLYLSHGYIRSNEDIDIFEGLSEIELNYEEFFDLYDQKGQRKKKLKILKDKEQEFRFEEFLKDYIKQLKK